MSKQSRQVLAALLAGIFLGIFLNVSKIAVTTSLPVILFIWLSSIIVVISFFVIEAHRMNLEHERNTSGTTALLNSVLSKLDIIREDIIQVINRKMKFRKAELGYSGILLVFDPTEETEYKGVTLEIPYGWNDNFDQDS